jgi:FkbM family methyltransferase
MDQNDRLNFTYLDKIIEKGDVLVDIGANQGIYTDFFKRLINEDGKIYTVELHPQTFKILVGKYANEKNIILENKAVSDKCGVVNFYLGVDSFTNNIIGHDMNFKTNEKGGEIESITLDKLLENEKHIKLIKIDVEGAEKMVLSGMKETIKKTDYVFVECHLDEDWVEISNLLLNEYNLHCTDIKGERVASREGDRLYQCLCRKK